MYAGDNPYCRLLIAEGGKILGERWRALSAEEKQKYKTAVASN
jgi:hypothetical protein